MLFGDCNPGGKLPISVPRSVGHLPVFYNYKPSARRGYLFDDVSLVLRDDLTAEDVENWDSLTHINLIVAIEKEFRIRFTTAEVSGLKNVGELEALIAAKVNR